jgi:hypothetical protein
MKSRIKPPPAALELYAHIRFGSTRSAIHATFDPNVNLNFED